MLASEVIDEPLDFTISLSLTQDVTIDSNGNLTKKHSKKQRLGPNGYPAFLFVGSAETIDHQSEIIDMDAILEVLPIMKRQGSNISGFHSNQPAGKWFEHYSSIITKADGEKIQALLLDVEVFDDFPSQQENLACIMLPDDDPKKIRGLSIGGRKLRKHRECTTKMCYHRVTKIEGWEFALVDEPACPLALKVDEDNYKIYNIKDIDETRTKEMDIMVLEKQLIKDPKPSKKSKKTEPKKLEKSSNLKKVKNAYIAYNGEGRPFNIRTGHFISQEKMAKFSKDELEELTVPKSESTKPNCKCGKHIDKAYKGDDEDDYPDEDMEDEEYPDEEMGDEGSEEGSEEYPDEEMENMDDGEHEQPDATTRNGETEMPDETMPEEENGMNEYATKKDMMAIKASVDKLMEAFSIQKIKDNPPGEIKDEAGNLYKLEKSVSQVEEEEKLSGLKGDLENAKKIYDEELEKLKAKGSEELAKGQLPNTTEPASQDNVDAEALGKVKEMGIMERIQMVASAAPKAQASFSIMD